MTRAADRLVVCGSRRREPASRRAAGTISIARRARSRIAIEEPADDGDGTVLALSQDAGEAETRSLSDAAGAQRRDARSAGLAARTMRRAETRRRAAVAVAAPSTRPRRSCAPAARRDAQALARGVVVHRLLQSLPAIAPEQRAEAARRYLARQSRTSTSRARRASRARCWRCSTIRASRRCSRRAAAPRFRSSARRRGGPRRSSGQVDRLVVTADDVLIADYKTEPRPRRERSTNVPHGLCRAARALSRGARASSIPDRPSAPPWSGPKCLI